MGGGLGVVVKENGKRGRCGLCVGERSGVVCVLYAYCGGEDIEKCQKKKEKN